MAETPRASKRREMACILGVFASGVCNGVSGIDRLFGQVKSFLWRVSEIWERCDSFCIARLFDPLYGSGSNLRCETQAFME